ncbi:unnamed protein product, partial [Brassica oleracea var. botrytis]
GSSGKQSCSGGRARSCGCWMQRKRRGGATSCGSGGARSCGSGGERCADSGGVRLCGSCGGTMSFTVVLLHKKVDLKGKEKK